MNSFKPLSFQHKDGWGHVNCSAKILTIQGQMETVKMETENGINTNEC